MYFGKESLGLYSKLFISLRKYCSIVVKNESNLADHLRKIVFSLNQIAPNREQKIKIKNYEKEGEVTISNDFNDVVNPSVDDDVNPFFRKKKFGQNSGTELFLFQIIPLFDLTIFFPIQQRAPG